MKLETPNLFHTYSIPFNNNDYKEDVSPTSFLLL